MVREMDLSLDDLRFNAVALVRRTGTGVFASCTDGIWSTICSAPFAPTEDWSLLEVVGGVVGGQCDVQVVTTAGTTVAREPLAHVSHAGGHRLVIPPLPSGGTVAVVNSDPSGRPVVLNLDRLVVHDAGTIPVGLSGDALLAVYDLNVRTAAFSVVPFLVAADRQRADMGARSLDVLVMPESRITDQVLGDSFRDAYPKAARRDFIERLLPAIAECLPAIRRVTMPRDRPAAQAHLVEAALPVFGADLSPMSPAAAASHEDSRAFCADAQLGNGLSRLSAPDAASRAVREWLDGLGGLRSRAVVTVTVRNERYMEAWNSRVEDWRAALADLDALVVLVPDPRLGAPSAPEGPWLVFPLNGVDSQVALYEIASLNLAQYADHAAVLLASRGPFVYWVPITGPGAVLSEDLVETLGLGPDPPPPFLQPEQSIRYDLPSPEDIRGAALSAIAAWLAPSPTV